MKKIIFFIIGSIFIPRLIGGLTGLVFCPQNYEYNSGFWWGVYVLIYILFPILYRPTIKQKMSKPAFYFLLYTILFLITGFCVIYFN